MNKFFNAAKIFVTGIFLCGMLLIGGKASAEVNQEAMEMLRETLMKVSEQNDLVFHQDVFLTMPQFTGTLELRTVTENDTYKMKGAFELFMVDDNGNEEYKEFPFYLTSDKKNNVAFYFQDEKKWKKWTSTYNEKDIADIPEQTDEETVAEIMEVVKDVTVLSDSDKKRTLLVKFNGEKVADLISKLSEQFKDEVAKSAENENLVSNAILSEIKNCVNTGLKNADFWFTWTVDKTKWQTTTASFNLSGVSQSIALAALDNEFVRNEESLREFFETIAFYSEVKGYTTFLNPNTKEKLEIPKNVLKAKEVKGFSDDDKDAKSKKK